MFHLSHFSLSALVALVLITLTYGYIKLWGGSKKRTLILMLGVSGAGKTALLYKLREGQLVETRTSMDSNTYNIELEQGSRSFTLVDIPGNPRLRAQYRTKLNQARAIVFLVDSARVVRNVREVAAFLYELLTSPSVTEPAVPITVLCNKEDLLTAMPVDDIRKLLEDELDRLRVTQSAALDTHDGLDESAMAHQYLGYEGQAFQFNQLANDIQFDSCSVKKDDSNTLMNLILSAVKKP
ncbi:hypothetical protein IWQ61_004743 [Dispira simplex]|nr:hypothetical protein IWQ61_004743 [Dispira simplex]